MRGAHFLSLLLPAALLPELGEVVADLDFDVVGSSGKINEKEASNFCSVAFCPGRLAFSSNSPTKEFELFHAYSCRWTYFHAIYPSSRKLTCYYVYLDGNNHSS